IILPFVVLLMIFRIVTGKEDVLRIKERFGLPSLPRSLRHDIIWIHAASVGESKIALTLARKLLEHLSQKYKILITTGTVTSAQIVRKHINSNIIHQYIPIDNYISVWMFLKSWKPKI